MVYENTIVNIAKPEVPLLLPHANSCPDMLCLILSHTHFHVSLKHPAKVFQICKSKVIADILQIQIRKMQQCTGVENLSHFL